MAPGKSIRQKIVEAYEDQLQTIAAGAIYNSALGANVNEWKETPFAETVTLGLVYKDTVDSTSQTFGNQEHNLRVSNEILVVGTAATMRQVIADFYTCIGADRTLGGLCEDISADTDETIEVDHNNRKAFWVTIRITIVYVSGNFSPYS